jgi:DNA-binding NarL/FixJ family response regulator
MSPYSCVPAWLCGKAFYLFYLSDQMKRHILLVDTDINERELFKAALGKVNACYTISYASCAVDAVTAMADAKPDFVFIENDLPFGNALHLLSFIKISRKLRKARVFIYTEMISDELSKMARLLGAAGCMQKKGAFNWLSHQLKAVIAGELMPAFMLLQYYTPLYDAVGDIQREPRLSVIEIRDEPIVLQREEKLTPIRQAG